MRATMSVINSMIVKVDGVDLGRFTQDGAVWNGLRCLANAEGEKIILQSAEPFSELIALLTSSGAPSEAEILTMSPSLIYKVRQKSNTNA